MRQFSFFQTYNFKQVKGSNMLNKKLKNLIALSCNVRIYVPTTFDIDNPTDTTSYVNKVLELLSTWFGGATQHIAFGAWKSATGSIVKEKVVICEAFCNQQDLNDFIELIYEHCLYLKIELRQESIALEVNNSLYLV